MHVTPLIGQPPAEGLTLITLPAPGVVLSYMGYIGMCGPKGYGLVAVLVINRVGFLHPSVAFGMIFFTGSYYFIIINNTINKSPS